MIFVIPILNVAANYDSSKNDLNMYIDDLKVVKSNEYSRELNNITISKIFFYNTFVNECIQRVDNFIVFFFCN